MAQREDNRSLKGIQIIGNQSLSFLEPIPDVHVASLPIAGCAWIDTGDGVVLIDTLIHEIPAGRVFEQITDTIKYIIYTHGHLDHIGGSMAFMADQPTVVANQYLTDRIDGYRMLAPHRSRISAQQFNLPDDPDRLIANLARIVYPTETFLGEKTISLGNKTFELHTARAETDDVCWVWVKEIEAAFIGDLIIGSFPNIGNPWKPTRFALDWAKTLEQVRAKEPQWVFCNGAGVSYQGQDALDALDANIEVIRSLHDQVVDLINAGVHISEMIHQVRLPEHLVDNKYLGMSYSKTEFFVYNVYRWYNGYFDGNPANLLPRPQKEVNREILGMIGEPDKVLARVRELLDQGQAQLGLQLLDILLQTQPDSIDARKLHIECLQTLGADDTCLMSRNAWVYFIEQDEALLQAE